MKRVINGLLWCVSLLSCLGLISAVEAVSVEGPVAKVMVGPDRIIWEPKAEHAGLVLTVAGPEGATFQKTFAPGFRPCFKLLDNDGNCFGNGPCNYELKAMPVIDPDVRRALAAARESGDGSIVSALQRAGKLPKRRLVQSGAFLIREGLIVMGDASADLIPDGRDSLAAAEKNFGDQIVHDDLIVTGSICAGFDCEEGESFNQDTILLKEQNLGIHFQDTSAGLSYPTNDWRISINSALEGGENCFAVTDLDGGVTPFKLIAGAPDNALYLDTQGRLGLGTSTPGARVHVTCGNTPFVRLEQDGTYGLKAQSWDVGGNDAYFGVRDATNGSRIPFLIEAGTPTTTLNLKSDGKVGIGTWTPAEPLSLVTTGQDARFSAERTDGATALVAGSTEYVLLGSITSHPIRFVSESEWIMQLNPVTSSYLHSLQMKNGAACTKTGVWTNNSSREYKKHIRGLSVDDAKEALKGLNPVRFYYKGDDTDEYVGFIAEEVPDLVATNDRKGMSPMDVVAVLTKVLQEQQKSIDEMSRKIADLERKLHEKDPMRMAVIPLSDQRFQ